jgi:hypothetical protein
MGCGVFHIPCAGRNGQAAVLVGWSWQAADQTAPARVCLHASLHCPPALAVHPTLSAPDTPCTPSLSAGDCHGMWCVPHPMRWPEWTSRGVGGMVLAGCGSDCACPCLLACLAALPSCAALLTNNPRPQQVQRLQPECWGRCGVWRMPHRHRCKERDQAAVVGWDGGVREWSRLRLPVVVCMPCCTVLLLWPFTQKPPPPSRHAPPASVLGMVMGCGVFHIPCAGLEGSAAVLVGWFWQAVDQTAPAPVCLHVPAALPSCPGRSPKNPRPRAAMHPQPQCWGLSWGVVCSTFHALAWRDQPRCWWDGLGRLRTKTAPAPVCLHPCLHATLRLTAPWAAIQIHT